MSRKDGSSAVFTGDVIFPNVTFSRAFSGVSSVPCSATDEEIQRAM